MRYAVLILSVPVAIYACLFIAYCSDILWQFRMRRIVRGLSSPRRPQEVSRMKRLALALSILVLAGEAAAGGISVKVNRHAIAVAPADLQGTIAVSGPPGCVTGLQPMQVVARNRKSDLTVAGAVAADGSFQVLIPARPKDTLKLTFIGADGRKKDVKVKVPEAVLSFPAPVRTELRTETLTVPSGVPAAPPYAPPTAGDELIIRGEAELGAAGVIE
ncbi:MAG: hypothetical protein PHN82_10425 [bacterium]|nr:hypothetical protein [bacterium]